MILYEYAGQLLITTLWAGRIGTQISGAWVFLGLYLWKENG